MSVDFHDEPGQGRVRHSSYLNIPVGRLTCNTDCAAGLHDALVGSDAVPLGRGGFDLEGDPLV